MLATAEAWAAAYHAFHQPGKHDQQEHKPGGIPQSPVDKREARRQRRLRRKQRADNLDDAGDFEVIPEDPLSDHPSKSAAVGEWFKANAKANLDNNERVMLGTSGRFGYFNDGKVPPGVTASGATGPKASPVYGLVNEHLRSQGVNTPYAKLQQQWVNDHGPNTRGWVNNNLIPKLDSGIAKGQVGKSVVAYRSFGSGKAGADLLGSLKVGDRFTDRGYSSVTIDKKWASNFGTHKVAIQIPKGTNAAFNRREGELLLKRNSTFTVVSKTDLGLVLRVVN